MSNLRPSRPLECNPPVSTVASSRPEIESSNVLVQYLDAVFPLADRANTQHREGVLNELVALFRMWVRQVCVAKGVFVDLEAAAEAGGAMFVSGSFKLGVNAPDSDIDVIAIAPLHVTREDFFDSLLALLRAQPGIERLLPIPDTKVPIIEMLFHGVSIDLGFASVPLNSVPSDINILDDAVLAGVDERSMIALNGPRANEIIYRAVPKPETFKVLLRALRYWGKVRGLNSNKMGFFGGINYAILSAYICQLYPNLSPAGLLCRFFDTFRQWKWPEPVMLTKPYTTNLGYPVWDRTDRRNMSQLMPILTPAYPCSNSAFNVSRSTLQVITLEIHRGWEICESIMRGPTPAAHDWSLLFQPTDFFYRFDSYLMIDVSADTQEHLQTWLGFVEARIRKLVDRFDLDRLPLLMAYLNPRIFTREELVPVAAPTPGTLTDLSAQAVTALPLDPIAAPAAESGTSIPVANSTPCDEKMLPDTAVHNVGSGDATRICNDVMNGVVKAPELSICADAAEETGGLAHSALPSANSQSSNELACLSARAGAVLGFVRGENAFQKNPDVGFPAATGNQCETTVPSGPCKDASSANHAEGPVAVVPVVVVPQVDAAFSIDGSHGVEPSAPQPAPPPSPLKRTVHSLYIGVMPDRERLKTEKLNLTPSMQAFKHDELEPWHGRKAGMTVRQRVLAWSDLPIEVFECSREEMLSRRHQSRTVVLPHVVRLLKALNQRAHHVWVRQPSAAGVGNANATSMPFGNTSTASASTSDNGSASGGSSALALGPASAASSWLQSLPVDGEALRAVMSAAATFAAANGEGAVSASAVAAAAAAATAAGLVLPVPPAAAPAPVIAPRAPASAGGLAGLVQGGGGLPGLSALGGGGALLGTPVGLWSQAVSSSGAPRSGLGAAAEGPARGVIPRTGLPGLTVVAPSASAGAGAAATASAGAASATSATSARAPPRGPNPGAPQRGPPAPPRALPPALRPPAVGLRTASAAAVGVPGARGPAAVGTPANGRPPASAAAAAATGLTPGLVTVSVASAHAGSGAPPSEAGDPASSALAPTAAAAGGAVAGHKRHASSLREAPQQPLSAGGRQAALDAEGIVRQLVPPAVAEEEEGEGERGGAVKRRSPRAGDAAEDESMPPSVAGAGSPLVPPIASEGAWPTVAAAFGAGLGGTGSGGGTKPAGPVTVPRGWRTGVVNRGGAAPSGPAGGVGGAAAGQAPAAAVPASLVPRAWSTAARL